MSDTHTEQERHRKRKHRNMWVLFLVFIWCFIGIAAYVQAFQCTSDIYGGGDARKIAMLLLAALLGPFWWFVYPAARRGGYCRLK
jgi:hypothetical protein